MGKPSLPQTFAEGLAIAAKKRGWTAYLPLRLAGAAVIALVIVWNLPSKLWSGDARSDLLAIYGGLLAFNGLLLAIGWSAFSRLYELIGSGPFSAFLKRNEILKYHILFIELAQLALVSSSLTSGFGLFSAWLPFLDWLDRTILGMSITLTAYAVFKAWESTQAMNELLWEASEFEEQEE
jgi:uncharacterized protein (DUF2062 family)